MDRECIGCGKDIPGKGDENQSGEWCVFGDCEIEDGDWEAVNRLRRAVLDIQKKGQSS